MTYTLTNIPKELDEALRKQAALEHKSVDQFIVDRLMLIVGTPVLSGAKKRDLSDIQGTWTDEDEANFQEVRAIHEQIDPLPAPIDLSRRLCQSPTRFIGIP